MKLENETPMSPCFQRPYPVLLEGKLGGLLARQIPSFWAAIVTAKNIIICLLKPRSSVLCTSPNSPALEKTCTVLSANDVI
jgi:hypothetical protein